MMDILYTATRLFLDVLRKIYIGECIETFKLPKVLIYPEKTYGDSLLYNKEEGNLSPKQQELPMLPPNWLV